MVSSRTAFAETMDATNFEVARDAGSSAAAFPGNPGFATVQRGPANERMLPPRRGGRKKLATPERVAFICKLLAQGETESSACLRAGIGATAWGEAKKTNQAIQGKVDEARDAWARVRHARHVNTLRENQWDRSATRKPLRPQPTKQANMVVWHLIRRVPLHLAAIPGNEVASACERFSLHPDTWQRQEQAFGLMRKVYTQRAKIRGEQPVQIARFNLAAWDSAADAAGVGDELARLYP